MKPYAKPKPFVLASDLDGTLIPLTGDQQNKADLQLITSRLNNCQTELVFVTGRHLAPVLNAVEEFSLPEPDWIICDVGTSIYQRDEKMNWSLTEGYAEELRSRLGLESIHNLRVEFENIAGLRLQEEAKQGQFKLSYYADAKELESKRNEVFEALSRIGSPSEIISSVDPFNGDGLLDILPPAASKADALTWLSRFRNLDYESIVFAGDSGNDFHAMIAGFKTIVVGNAAQSLTTEVEMVHRTLGWNDRLYLSAKTATSGVLEGCRFFGLFDDEN